MYLMRIGGPGDEKPVARIDEHTYVDLSDVVRDFDEAFFGSDGLARIRPVVAERNAAGHVSRFAGERIGAPIARPHQILCIGLNYSDHAAETGQAVPDEPILFTKSPNTLIGPNDDVRIPRGSTKPDWEVELGIVVGRRASYLDSNNLDFRSVVRMLSSDFTGISAQATGSALLIEFPDRRFERHCIPFITVEHANRTGEPCPKPASSTRVRLIRGSRPHVLRLVPEGPL